MNLIKPSFELLTDLNELTVLEDLERYGRTCYKSEDRITEDSSRAFVTKLIVSGHHSVIEHINVSVRIVCDRGVTHELVRHRLVSYSQESTRYCNYQSGVTYIKPFWLKNVEYGYYDRSRVWTLFGQGEMSEDEYFWMDSMIDLEQLYEKLIRQNWSPQMARSVLPNALKTEIIVTANLREWRHIFFLRCASAAHPQMQEIMIPMLKYFNLLLPTIFADVHPEITSKFEDD